MLEVSIDRVITLPTSGLSTRDVPRVPMHAPPFLSPSVWAIFRRLLEDMPLTANSNVSWRSTLLAVWCLRHLSLTFSLLCRLLWIFLFLLLLFLLIFYYVGSGPVHVHLVAPFYYACWSAASVEDLVHPLEKFPLYFDPIIEIQISTYLLKKKKGLRQEVGNSCDVERRPVDLWLVFFFGRQKRTLVVSIWLLGTDVLWPPTGSPQYGKSLVVSIGSDIRSLLVS